MICSQNEITAVLYKAAIGSGLSVGLAQDLAKVGAWLCSTGRPGLGLSLDAMDSDIGAWCSSFDLLASEAVKEVKLQAPVSLELLEGFAHLAGSNYELTYNVEPDQDGGAIVTCTPLASGSEGIAPKSQVEQIEVDPKQLERAQSLAHKTYVPATDESRLSGAGAGLTDND